MSGLDIFAWIVLITILFAAVIIFVVLARLPGRIATRRKHPQAEAINVAGWLGLFFFGIIWVLALIWAFTVPSWRRARTTHQIKDYI